MHVKRWLVLLLAGMFLLAFGLAFGLRELYIRGFRWPGSVYYLTLQFLPRPLKALVVVLLGVGAVLVAIWRLNSSLLHALLPEQDTPHDIAELVYARRLQPPGLRVVALGGGHGLSTLLSGLKEHTEEIVAIVNVADDGGSSGRLRREFGVLPPGDIRRCLAALAAKDEALMAELFEYRFDAGEGLEGHTFGNLLITALDDITGSFDAAVQAASKILAVRGQVLPPTLSNVTLAAELRVPPGAAPRRIEGELQLGKSGLPIARVLLNPSSPPAYPAAVAAVRAADLIVVGPGSLYTSILPVLLVPELRAAIHELAALVVYVCNVATEPGETDHFGVQDHLAALVAHVGVGCIDVALVNANEQPANNFAPEWQGRTAIVPLDVAADAAAAIPIVPADVINPANPLRHDPHKLAAALIALVRERRKPTAPHA